LFVCHAPSLALCSFEGDILYWSIQFTRLFGRIVVSDALERSHFVDRWRHNFRKISVKNSEKSKIRRKSLCAVILGSERLCATIKEFSVCRYIALTITIKVRIGSPKTARNEQVCAQEVNFPKYVWVFMQVRDCNSAVFLSGVRWRHSKPPDSEPHFWPIFLLVCGRLALLIMHRFGRVFADY